MRLVTRAFVIEEGQRFGRYTITGYVGPRGMGEVKGARRRTGPRSRIEVHEFGLYVDLLTREAQMASALNPPGMATVHNVVV